MRWDPAQYDLFSVARGRPFPDLLSRIGADAPRRVVDLGCGPGGLTARLKATWPEAQVEGVDSSPQMIEAAASLAAPGLTFRVGDALAFEPAADLDVLVSSATLQWVPEHPDLLRRWAAAMPAGGWLAWQVPGNFDSPSYRALRELTAEPVWVQRLGDRALRPDSVLAPREYATLLLDLGAEADAWETTYEHVLSGPDPVLEWMRGTALLPVLSRLSEDDAATFEAELATRLRALYPQRADGTTVFSFRRVFAVGRFPS